MLSARYTFGVQSRIFLLPALTLLAFGTMACGASTERPTQTVVQADEPPPPPKLPPLPKGEVWRAEVMEFVSPGMGTFLQRVDVRESMVNSQFHGFRIMQLRGDPDFWKGVDLASGDVVTSVNGQPIGHYDEAFAVWKSLAVANEIVVSYERASEKRELRWKIRDEQPAPAK